MIHPALEILCLISPHYVTLTVLLISVKLLTAHVMTQSEAGMMMTWSFLIFQDGSDDCVPYDNFCPSPGQLRFSNSVPYISYMDIDNLVQLSLANSTDSLRSVLSDVNTICDIASEWITPISLADIRTLTHTDTLTHTQTQTDTLKHNDTLTHTHWHNHNHNKFVVSSNKRKISYFKRGSLTSQVRLELYLSPNTSVKGLHPDSNNSFF